MQGKREGSAQPSVCINTTKNVRNSDCRYVPLVYTHKAFPGRRNACRILIRIPTNGLAPSSIQNSTVDIQQQLNTLPRAVWLWRVKHTARTLEKGKSLENLLLSMHSKPAPSALTDHWRQSAAAWMNGNTARGNPDQTAACNVVRLPRRTLWVRDNAWGWSVSCMSQPSCSSSLATFHASISKSYVSPFCSRSVWLASNVVGCSHCLKVARGVTKMESKIGIIKEVSGSEVCSVFLLDWIRE